MSLWYEGSGRWVGIIWVDESCVLIILVSGNASQVEACGLEVPCSCVCLVGILLRDAILQRLVSNQGSKKNSTVEPYKLAQD